MPKRVDHQERRRQIAEALLRVAAARGLHAAGMREVAAEAGVSLRLVQYYFGTKEELLLFATQQLAARFSERGMARISRLKEAGSPRPRDVIAAILAEALPADEEMRTFYVVYTAYLALSLTDPALAIAPLVKNSGAVTGVIAAQLRAAQDAGDTPSALDPDLEAFSLTAMSAGLATSVLTGQTTAGQAQAVIDYHLSRLFPASAPALHATRPQHVPNRQSGCSHPPGRYSFQRRRVGDLEPTARLCAGLAVLLREVGDPDFLDGPLACPVGGRQLIVGVIGGIGRGVYLAQVIDGEAAGPAGSPGLSPGVVHRPMAAAGAPWR